MATIQKKTQVQNTQDFIRIQDLLYMCLAKWHWFVFSLAVCLGVAIAYLLRTPPVYTRSASILIKDDSKGKSASTDMESFADFGIFTTNTNVNNEMGTLQSPDLMREVVTRLHLEMNYLVEGRFHKNTIYGDQLPVTVTLTDLPDNQSATFHLHLSKEGSYTLNDLTRNGEPVEGEVKGQLGDTIQSPFGKIAVTATAHYQKGQEAEMEVIRSTIKGAVGNASSRLTVSQNDEKSNIISLSFQDVSIQRAEEVLNTLISVYNENWVKDKNQIAVSTSMFINERLGVIEGELGNVDNDISSYKSQHLLPDVQAAANMYMAQASEANTAIKSLNNQTYMARYIRNYLTSETNRFQLLPANSGIDNPNIASQINEYNNQLLERNNLVSKSSVKNPLVIEMDASLASMRKALVSSIDNQLVALEAQIRSQQSYGGQATSQIASNPKQAKYLLS
ncbi:MAG: chromosome partitioning protein ParA, partial [Bacteroidaceae bacterium]|nr:chromosome partitioning protein ParA [Bacteroidaceae bacterium]